MASCEVSQNILADIQLAENAAKVAAYRDRSRWTELHEE